MHIPTPIADLGLEIFLSPPTPTSCKFYDQARLENTAIDEEILATREKMEILCEQFNQQQQKELRY